MIKQKKIDQINEFLTRWDGAHAEFNHYKVGMGDLFGIALSKDGMGKIGVRFSVPLYIQGSTFWSNAVLRCAASIHDGSDCFEVKDKNSDFKVVVGSTVMAGDGELFVTVAD